MGHKGSNWPIWISGVINKFFRDCTFFTKPTKSWIIIFTSVIIYANVFPLENFRKYNFSDFLLQLNSMMAKNIKIIVFYSRIKLLYFRIFWRRLNFLGDNYNL